ncbi:hypothetical protein MHB42_09550 [Lysinibacillus sp. FSL K6-0232]|uniref:DUF7832 domain-containing protein n=1 Tax=unclassified Lysinibacillus TaxID=2636778 RepID=UPI0030F985CD
MVIVYDKAKYHIEGDFPANLAIKQAYVHTGMFVGWLIDNQLYSEELEEDGWEEIVHFQARRLTGTELYQAWDGVLTDDMLNREGNAFAASYFDFEQGCYLQDYEETFASYDSLYAVEDTWENYWTLKAVIDQRYQEWQHSK